MTAEEEEEEEEEKKTGVWSFVLFNDAWSQKGHSASMRREDNDDNKEEARHKFSSRTYILNLELTNAGAPHLAFLCSKISVC